MRKKQPNTGSFIEQSTFQTIFRHTPISTQIFRLDGMTIMVNPAWEKLWLIKKEDVIGKYNVLKDKQLVEEGIMTYIQRGFSGKTVKIPAIRYVPEKSVPHLSRAPYRWVSAIVYPILEDNRIVNIVLQHEDITSQKDSEEASQRFISIIESSDDAIISKTLDGIITSWNKGAQRIFGYTEKEMIGQHITKLIPKENWGEEDRIISNLNKGRKIDHFETIRLHKNGQPITVSLSISPIRDRSGKVIGESKIARDISATRKAERQRIESEERLRIALDAGKIGVWDWNIVDNSLTWTDHVYTIHGVSKKTFAVTLDSYLNLIHPEDREKAKADLDHSLKNNVPFSQEVRIVTPKGEVRWTTTTATTFYDKKGKPIRMLGATSDITRQKQLDQEKSDFLSMASHELKTPLTSMKLFVDLLHHAINDAKTDRSSYYVQRIRDQADRLSELTNDLLDVSRIETGKLRLNKEEFVINDLIRDTIESLQPSTKTHTIVFRSSRPVNVTGDHYRIYQVLVNLLTNAIKYSPNGKEIIVRLKKSSSAVSVSVQDFGIGIKKIQQKKIFDRLYQVTEPTEKTYPGLGLGLYISKEIVERHKGKIWVESEKGKGSTFTFSIPLVS